MKPELLDLQASIESDIASSSESKKLAIPSKDTDFGNTAIGMAMIRSSVNDIAEGVAEWFASIKALKGGKYNAHGSVIADQDAAFVAYVATKALLSRMHVPNLTLVRAANHISRVLQREMWLKSFQKHNRKLYDELMRDMARRNNTKELKNALVTWSAAKDGFTPQAQWSRSLQTAIGTKLIEIIIQKTEWIEIINVYSSKRQTYFIKRTKKFNLFAEYWMQTSFMRPDYQPTVVPPKPWDSWWGGGYYTDALPPLTLVKSADHEFLKDNNTSGVVFDTVNAMQNVGWRLNRQVYDVFDAAFALRLEIAGMPMNTENVHYERAPEDASEEVAREFRLTNIKKFEAVRVAQQHWLELAQIRRMADFYKDHEFFYPYTLDFRGRIYPVVALLNPQGADVAKGLLLFSKGKPLTASGWSWLMIHGANSWDNGLTKLTFNERVDFVKRNEAKIIQCAEAPLDYTYWSGAENPWQFLAFCFEYARLKRDPSADSVLPIGMDGTCNGLQHFSAMLRDPVGGSATNLVPASHPADIYQRVADVVTDRLKAAHSPIAERWLEFGIDRKATKRQVMTLPYGSTLFSCYRYTREWFKDAKDAGKPSPFYSEEAENEALKYLSNMIWDAIGQVVVAAKAAMNWLRECADAVGGQPIVWTAPSGFKVKQQYFEMKTRRIRTAMMGNIIRPRIMEKSEDISTYNQRNGISPNFVHSFDAAHVKLTVKSLLGQGIDTFAFVHDNYLCLATDAPAMARTLRETFVDLHERPALEVLAEELRAQGHNIPDPPAVGTLDLRQVEQSPFFFA